MTELETAQKRIADLEEEVERMTRQLAVMARHVFGKRSEQRSPTVGAPLDLVMEAV